MVVDAAAVVNLRRVAGYYAVAYGEVSIVADAAGGIAAPDRVVAHGAVIECDGAHHIVVADPAPSVDAVGAATQAVGDG